MGDVGVPEEGELVGELGAERKREKENPKKK